MTKARRNPQLRSLPSDAQPGDWDIIRCPEVEKSATIWFTCPCGCGCMARLPLRPSVERASWQWDGNEESPTLYPSVHHQVDDGAGGLKTHWHGWLRAGEWVSC